MKRFFLLLALASFSGGALADDAAPNPVLEVVASHPALSSIAKRVGAPHVNVTSLCAPTGDVHSVEATPSLLARLSNADAFLHSGLDLELWVEPAVKGARNPKIRSGALGNVDCSIGIDMLNVPANPSRADGDVHVYGNPHYWLDPQNGKKIAATICAAFCALAPEHAADFQKERAAFDQEVNKALIGWLKRVLPTKGAQVVCFHDSFPYFLRRFGWVAGGFVEPKPRIPPTQSHLLSLIESMNERSVRVIVREPFHDPASTEFLAAKTGARVVTLAQMPGAIENSDDYIAMIGRNVDLVLAALEAK